LASTRRTRILGNAKAGQNAPLIPGTPLSNCRLALNADPAYRSAYASGLCESKDNREAGENPALFPQL
jgi:hypothetical protein